MIEAKLTGSGNRKWKLRVSQIPCDSTYTPPSGCQMYYMGLSGVITSYNWNADRAVGYHLNNMDYQ